MNPGICYIYEYNDNQKLRNAGFIKLIQHYQSCVLQVNVRGIPVQTGSTVKLYAFCRQNSKFISSQVDEIICGDKCISARFTISDTTFPEGRPLEQIDGFFLKTDSGQYYAATADGADFDTRGIELWKKTGESTAAVSEEPAPSAVPSPESAEADPATGTGLPVTNDAEAQAESQSLPENTDSSDAYNDPENVMYSNTFHESGDDITPDTFRDFDAGLYFDSFSDPDVDISSDASDNTDTNVSSDTHNTSETNISPDALNSPAEEDMTRNTRPSSNEDDITRSVLLPSNEEDIPQSSLPPSDEEDIPQSSLPPSDEEDIPQSSPLSSDEEYITPDALPSDEEDIIQNVLPSSETEIPPSEFSPSGEIINTPAEPKDTAMSGDNAARTEGPADTIRTELQDSLEEEAQTAPTARKIQRSELSILPRRCWNLANNSFLLHGYHNYHHLLLVEEDGRYWLGVPAIYSPREARAAELFGFPQFTKTYVDQLELDEDEKAPSPDFGHFCRYIR
ncbi:MAG: hypothetical protein U0I51_14755 [Muricomes sp.]|uniref:hypothetical protein n=1 Tax=Faecalicatena contorta TaxID=39482 RepID=UPI002EAD7153|nr:hypothetical protein [Muricomes sp.]